MEDEKTTEEKPTFEVQPKALVQARYYDHEVDYPILQIWWSDREFPPVHPLLLPRIGIIMEDLEKNPLCAGFLYGTDSSVAQIAHVVSDVRADKELRGHALDVMILTLCDLARQAGFLVVSTSSNLSHMVERYERLGFETHLEQVTTLAKEVGVKQ